MDNIEKSILDIKRNMEIEGFNIPDELVEKGYKIAKGELNADKFVEKCIQRAKEGSV